MKLKDTAELIRCDIPDLTEGAFDVAVESDDGGNHIVVSLEEHDSQNVMKHLTKEYPKTRTIVMLVPSGWLAVMGKIKN
mgnify:FL=1